MFPNIWAWWSTPLNCWESVFPRPRMGQERGDIEVKHEHFPHNTSSTSARNAAVRSEICVDHTHLNHIPPSFRCHSASPTVSEAHHERGWRDRKCLPHGKPTHSIIRTGTILSFLARRHMLPSISTNKTAQNAVFNAE